MLGNWLQYGGQKKWREEAKEKIYISISQNIQSHEGENSSF